jgi:hypothetical protein
MRVFGHIFVNGGRPLGRRTLPPKSVGEKGLDWRFECKSSKVLKTRPELEQH